MNKRRVVENLVVLALVAGLGACGWIPSQSEYEPVDPGRALEVPPDLDQPDTRGALRVPNATYSRVQGGPIDTSAPETVAGNSASAKPATQMVYEGGVQSLVVADSEEGAWRRIGYALERIGLDVEDEQRDSGTYVVDYVDVAARDARPGAFSRWILRKKGPTDHSGTYQLKLRADGESTRVDLLDESGNPADPVLTEELLQALMDRLG